MKFAASLLFALTLCFPAVAKADASPAWQKTDLVNVRLELQDPTGVEILKFLKDGSVLVTMGAKNGAVASPVFNWKLTDDGKLQIFDEGKMWEELTLVSRADGSVTAHDGEGRMRLYKVTK